MINDVIMSDADCTPGREPRSDFRALWNAAIVPIYKLSLEVLTNAAFQNARKSEFPSSFFRFPIVLRLISAAADWISTILRHIVWP